ncbi:MAG: phosphoribosylformylglycinamidine cyclo-ligase [Candidatus Marinimicrobia bacterium]|nr:phosphoribosylformylglycinamidine cyclo-ligase [Candidatus Neomarinimicrobiota bacterium]
MTTTYKDSGVDIDTANESIQRIKKHVKSTYNSNVLTEIGSFGGCFEFPTKSYNKPVLVSSTDGVGTKLKIAFLMGKHYTIGQCLVNHCVNDILTTGAIPLFFLDYFATSRLEPQVVEQVVEGLSIACKENKCALIGGETAEMPGFYQMGEYDMSGTITGVVEKDQLLSNRSVSKGDVLVGLKSSGLHTNGYSLARHVLLSHFDVDDYVDELDLALGEELLKIHRSYLSIVQPILKQPWLKAISHITGGGLVENTNRVIGDNLKLVINWESWDVPAIFKLIQNLGKVPEDDMRRAMNMGIGMVFIVDQNHVDKVTTHLSEMNEPHVIIGNIE